METKVKKDRIEAYAKIPCGMIQTSPIELHPRGKGMKALRASIRTNGLLVPISICQKEDKSYVVVDGVRRLAAWREEYPDQPVPAILLSYPTELVDEGQVDKADCIKRDTFASNGGRMKVPKKKIEEYVMELRAKKMGYGAIADIIGFKKSGVQKIVARLERDKLEHSSEAYTVKKKTTNKIKRMRTSLHNLLGDLAYVTAEETEIFRRIDDILKEHESVYVEELEREKSLSED